MQLINNSEFVTSVSPARIPDVTLNVLRYQ
jgi:hypothetical protein